jgi:hypothetical protein
MMQRLSKALSPLAIAALLISSFASGFAFVPNTADAATFSYTISVTNSDFTGNTLTLTGSAFIDNYVGNIAHQWVSFDWGDGSTVEKVNTQDMAGYSQSAGDITITNWTKSHTYTTTGSFSVIVKIYHGNASGNEGSADDSNTVTIQTENTALLCSDTLDNDHDSLTDLDDPDCAAFLNTVPVAGADATSTPEDVAVVIPAADLLANDTDAYLPHNTLSVIAVGNAASGTVMLSGGLITFTPAPDFNGIATFDYDVSNGSASSTGTVSVTVTPVNDAPMLTLLGTDPISLAVDSVFTDPGATSTDAEDANLPIVITGTVSTSTVGSYVLTYTVTDTGGLSASTTRTVIITAKPVENTAGLCSDSVDNDGDSLTDLADPDCAAFVPPAPSSGGGGGGSTGANGPIQGTFGVVPFTPIGQVLGTSTGPVLDTNGEVLVDSNICAPYLTTYIKLGQKNDAAEVKKLQTFLNEIVDAKLPITGFYGPRSYAAVKELQLKASDEILKPWLPYGLPNDKTATGYVYKTTRRYINNLKCPALNLPMPDLSK